MLSFFKTILLSTYTLCLVNSLIELSFRTATLIREQTPVTNLFIILMVSVSLLGHVSGLVDLEYELKEYRRGAASRTSIVSRHTRNSFS